MTIFSSCSVGPSYIPPEVQIPSEWKTKQENVIEESGSTEDKVCYELDYWWQVFNDPKLEELQASLIQNNWDLMIALERIQEAQAIKKIAAANFYPSMTLDPMTSNVMELYKSYSYNTSTPPFRSHQMLYSLPVHLSYEVDLWGKIRDKYNSAKYDWLAQKKDYEAVMLNLTAHLAITYYQLRTADKQIDLLDGIIKTRKKVLEINEARYTEKIIFLDDVLLSVEELDNFQSEYLEINRQRKALENIIAVLIGTPPSEFFIEHNPIQNLPPIIPEGLPSEILVRRPDIIEAGYQTESQHALVKHAFSQFFPSIVLTSAGGVQSSDFKNFLTVFARYWKDGIHINQLLFDGGATYNNYQLQIKLLGQANANYQQKVLTAFQEVEDALINLESYEQQYEIALKSSDSAQRRLQLYFDRYSLGVNNYINVANGERDWLNNEIDVSLLIGFRYVATIQMIQALGGSW